MSEVNNQFHHANVVKFDGTNFQLWKFQIVRVLLSLKLKKITLGEEIRPLDNTNEAQDKWDEKDARAAVILSSTMTTEQMRNCLMCVTANEIWKKLCSIHEEHSENNKLLLLNKFHQCKLETGETVLEYTSKIENIVCQLKDIGENISDSQVMSKTLSGLSMEYSNFSTAWDSTDPVRQTFQNLQERLIKEEKKMKKDNDEQDLNVLAVTSQCRPNGQRSMKYNLHRKRDEQRASRENRQGNFISRYNSNLRCYNCNGYGHISKYCSKPARKQNNQGQGEPNCSKYNSSNLQVNSTLASALIATVHDFEKLECNAISEIKDKLHTTDIMDVWLTDSACTVHMSPRRDWFVDFKPLDKVKVYLGDNTQCDAMGTGTILIARLIEGKWIDGRIENVLFVPALKKNLFLTNVATRKGFRVIFEAKTVKLEDPRTHQVVAEGVKAFNDICCLFFRIMMPQANAGNLKLSDLHETLGHVNHAELKHMIKNKVVDGIADVTGKEAFCEGCILGKMHRKPDHERTYAREYQVGESIHADLCGPMSLSVGGNRYFFLIKDRRSHFRRVFFIKHKNEAFDCFKQFYREAVRQGKVILTFRVDNGTEFVNKNFKKFLSEEGIRLGTSVARTPKQNGRIERENRTIVESARSMMHAKQLPKDLWAEAVNTAVYSLNRTTNANNRNFTPFEMWYGRKPDVSHMRPFGSDAYSFVHETLRKKFDAKAVKMILVGYHEDSTNYRLFDPVSRKVVIACDVKFNVAHNESTVPLLMFSNLNEAEDKELSDESVLEAEQEDEQDYASMNSTNDMEESMDLSEEEPVQQHIQDVNDKQKRGKKRNSKESNMTLRDRTLIKKPKRYEGNVVDIQEPINFSDAMNGSDVVQWKSAVAEELHSHKVNNTWDIVVPPVDANLLDTTWVFKVKTDSAGNVDRYKARLCARGFMQRPGIDYFDTYAPVARYESIRVLFALAAQKNLEMVQFDIKTAYLYSELKE